MQKVHLQIGKVKIHLCEGMNSRKHHSLTCESKRDGKLTEDLHTTVKMNMKPARYFVVNTQPTFSPLLSPIIIDDEDITYNGQPLSALHDESSVRDSTDESTERCEVRTNKIQCTEKAEPLKSILIHNNLAGQ